MTNHKAEEYLKLSDQELLDLAKKAKSNSITNALFIGALAGIIIYSIVKNSYGFITLIPLFMIYKLVGKPVKDEALNQELTKRNLR